MWKSEFGVALEGVEGLERIEAEVDDSGGGLNRDTEPLDLVGLEGEAGTKVVRFVLFDNNGGLNCFCLTGTANVEFCGEIGREDAGFPRDGLGGVIGR